MVEHILHFIFYDTNYKVHTIYKYTNTVYSVSSSTNRRKCLTELDLLTKPGQQFSPVIGPRSAFPSLFLVRLAQVNSR